MEHRYRLHLLAVTAISLIVALAAQARVFMTQQQALASAFPAGSKIERQTFFLHPNEVNAARKESGVDFADRMIVRYTATVDGRVAGHAYFDTHMVRTLPETVMIVVTPDAKVGRVELLSFDEPPDYQPKPRWIDQLRGKKLDDDLSLKRAIRPMTGATLSGRAIVNASRKVLALHRILGAR